MIAAYYVIIYGIMLHDLSLAKLFIEYQSKKHIIVYEGSSDTAL